MSPESESSQNRPQNPSRSAARPPPNCPRTAELGRFGTTARAGSPVGARKCGTALESTCGKPVLLQIAEWGGSRTPGLPRASGPRASSFHVTSHSLSSSSCEAPNKRAGGTIERYASTRSESRFNGRPRVYRERRKTRTLLRQTVVGMWVSPAKRAGASDTQLSAANRVDARARGFALHSSCEAAEAEQPIQNSQWTLSIPRHTPRHGAHGVTGEQFY